MSRTASGYARQPSELYETPLWVLDALCEHFPLAFKEIWEPACGPGKLVRAMEAHLATVAASDINDYGWDHKIFDFLTGPVPEKFDGIVANPPYGPRGETATAFLRRGLHHIRSGGFMATLLPIDFDSALTRADLFENCSAFAAKIVLRKRIMWFPGDSSPTQNHAWFIHAHTAFALGTPRLLYGPKITEKTHED